jgi:DNA mismatch repair protein PMS2
MATIKAIEGHSVHQIQSGQVIVDLNSVVKELVENSLDAGATSIEVRFKNQGLDSIEVSDNGKGIAPEDFETIALKHYTSKLSSYEDLTSLETFGFRGEALSSLCALSKIHIITARAEDGAVGKRLDFEVSGKLKGTSVVAAQRGTTVVVENLFRSLPVRRKELEKNIKREYGKVTTLLNSYACVSVGVRYAVSNQMPKCKKVVVFSTKSNTTTKENIVNIFGAKTLLALVKLDLKLNMEPSKGPSTQGARNRSTQGIDRSREVLVQGHISKPVFGEGRQAPDRQMFFVNSRPCGLPQVSKAFNEVYKSFNVSQSPFIFANLIMDTNAYDVNVSPDKRSIMLHDQTALLDSLKSALAEMFEQTDHTIPQSIISNRKLPSFQALTPAKKPSTGPFLEEDNHEQSRSEAGSQGYDDEAEVAAVPASRRDHGNTTAAPVSLIESWASRDSELRNDKRVKPRSAKARDKAEIIDANGSATNTATNRTSVSPLEHNGSAINRESRSGANNGQEGDSPILPPNRSLDDPDTMSTAYDDLFPQRSPQVPQRVRDFNAFMEQARESERTEHPAEEPGQLWSKGANHLVGQEVEPEILATQSSSQKATPGPVANAFDRMRSKRTPQQIAEITIGDQTTSTVIGSVPMYKKRRVHEPVNSQAATAFGCSPLLARGLRSFAAPGTQIESDDSDAAKDLTRHPASHAFSDGDEGTESGEDEPGLESLPKGGGLIVDDDDSTLDAELLRLANDGSPDPDSMNIAFREIQDDGDDDSDENYLDEKAKKIQEDAKVARLVQEAEESAAKPSSHNLQRASQVLNNSRGRKESTLQLSCTINPSLSQMELQAQAIAAALPTVDDHKSCQDNAVVRDELDSTQAETKLSLTVTKADFKRMRIVGQFNLGFVLAIRPPSHDQDQDELFIIDQHAADEKYNYERFSRTISLQSQRLVQPKLLDLTAVEQEVVLNHSDALKANGFEIEVTSTDSDDMAESTTRTCRLLTLPTSHTTTFDLSDLSELLYLLSDTPTSSSIIPRPKKVQRMLAMRACRSSIMVGKVLTLKQMEQVVSHMGGMEKPWNCPHGRPTMRHLVGLGEWSGWREGLAISEDVEHADHDDTAEAWKAWLQDRA